jgi:hypothetical protein
MKDNCDMHLIRDYHDHAGERIILHSAFRWGDNAIDQAKWIRDDPVAVRPSISIERGVKTGRRQGR